MKKIILWGLLILSILPQALKAQMVIDTETSSSTEKLLKVKDKNNISVKLLDKNGFIVDKGKIKDGIIKFSVVNLPNNTYFLHIIEGEELVVKQILIQH